MEVKQSNKPALYKPVLFIAVTMLLLLIWLVFIKRSGQADESIFNMLSHHVTEGRTSLIKGITFLGNHAFLIPANLLLILFFLLQNKIQDALRVLLIALSSLGLMSLLKNLFQRHRPMNPLVEGITNYSFPSGHAFMSIAFYGLLIWFIHRRWKEGLGRTVAIVLLLILIFLIGFSRVYLRVHYTTDVLAGWLFGSIWLLVCLCILNKLLERKAIASKKT